MSTASTGDAVLELLQTMEVDLILLNIYMPAINGLQLLDRIRKSDHAADVTVITAASDMSSIKMALRLGAVDYLIKPFEFHRLFSSGSVHIQGRREVDGNEASLKPS